MFTATLMSSGNKGLSAAEVTFASELEILPTVEIASVSFKSLRDMLRFMT